MASKTHFSHDDHYAIHIDGRHVQVTDAMKEYALNKLGKIEKFHTHINDIHVVMDIQKIEHSVSIIVKSDHCKIKSHASSSDMYASIDQAVDRLEKQISKWKTKLQEHHSKNLSTVDMKVNVVQRPYNEVEEYNAEIESKQKADLEKALMPGHVIGEKTLPLKDLLVEEAIMKMELSGDPFLLYRSQEDLKVKVIYRMDDGNYGIIHTQ